MPKEKSIEIFIPNRRNSSQICASLAKTLHILESPETDTEYDYNITFSYVQPIDANRNRMVKKFLNKKDAEWLLMIDSDITPPKTILKMIEHNKPVVSAVTMMKKKGPPKPLILKRAGKKLISVGIEEYKDQVDEDGLIKVDGVGTGCLLIRRDVLEEMEPPWFRFQYNEYGDLALGEDFYFSQKCTKNDVPMYISSNFICGHFRTVDLLEILRIVNAVKEEMKNEEEN